LVPHIAILGGGPGGYVAAIRARQLGADVTLIEMDRLGGTCLNRGCIPSKALLRSAELSQLAGRLDEFGIQAEVKGIDWPRIIERKNEVVDQVVTGVEFLMKKNKINVVAGKGRLVDAKTIVAETEAGEETITADRVVLATGSIPARLPLPGFDSPSVLTSTELLEIDHIPPRLCIIGAGYVGVEFADIFNSVGSEVTIIEMMPQIVPTEDADIAAELARAFRRRRIAAHTNSRVKEVADRNGARVVRFTRDDDEKEVEADVILCAVGRWPNTEGLGFEEAGLEMDRRAIRVSSKMETSAEGVYAIGDAVGGIMLAHVASSEGKVAAATAMGQEVEMDYTAIPTVTYTHPEIGGVGLTEKQAQDKGIDTSMGKFFFRGAGKATAEGTREGVVKVIVDRESGKVVGGQICGPHATELIHELVLAVHVGATAEEVGEMVHAHPTLMEPIMEAAEDALGIAIHK
jgi:dihydrolipoamide dehydrogenase